MPLCVFALAGICERTYSASCSVSRLVNKWWKLFCSLSWHSNPLISYVSRLFHTHLGNRITLTDFLKRDRDMICWCDWLIFWFFCFTQRFCFAQIVQKNCRGCLCWMQVSHSLKQSRLTWWRVFVSRTWSRCSAVAPDQPWMALASAFMRARLLPFLATMGLGRPPPCTSHSCYSLTQQSCKWLLQCQCVAPYFTPLIAVSLCILFFFPGPSWLACSLPPQGQPPSTARTSAQTWTASACLWECALNTTSSFSSM